MADQRTEKPFQRCKNTLIYFGHKNFCFGIVQRGMEEFFNITRVFSIMSIGAMPIVSMRSMSALKSSVWLDSSYREAKRFSHWYMSSDKRALTKNDTFCLFLCVLLLFPIDSRSKSQICVIWILDWLVHSTVIDYTVYLLFIIVGCCFRWWNKSIVNFFSVEVIWYGRSVAIQSTWLCVGFSGFSPFHQCYKIFIIISANILIEVSNIDALRKCMCFRVHSKYSHQT